MKTNTDWVSVSDERMYNFFGFIFIREQSLLFFHKKEPEIAKKLKKGCETWDTG